MVIKLFVLLFISLAVEEEEEGAVGLWSKQGEKRTTIIKLSSYPTLLAVVVVVVGAAKYCRL